MSSIDVHGNVHRGAGTPGAGQFAGRVSAAPAGTLNGYDSDQAECDRCGVGDREAGSTLCAECQTCARCERPANEDDGLCSIHTARWGTLSLASGSRTPWGPADSVTDIAPGIVSVSTATHGGVKLSPERNTLIPAPFRDASGWYEEDAERDIVIRYFADEWPAADADVGRLRQGADQSLRDHYPRQWELVNGRELKPGESLNKDRQLWTERHKDAFVSRAAWASESDPDLMLVTACRSSDGVEAQYLVPRAEYRAAQQSGEWGSDSRVVIDPTRHPMLPPLNATKSSKPGPTLYKPEIPSGSALSQMYIDGVITATARDRIARDLGRRWKQEDGSVLSLQEIVNEKGVTARSARQEGTAINYRLIRPSGDGGQVELPVSKAMFDLLDDIPDDRSPAEIARQAYSVYQERLDRKHGGGIPSEHARANELYKKYRELKGAEDTALGVVERRLTQVEREQAARITA